MTGSFTDLRVWQNGMKLFLAVHKVTRTFPKEELYGLTSQVRRAAMSIPNCIAEGKGYNSKKDFVRFLYMARGSCLEVQSELIIARELQYLAPEDSKTLLSHAALVGRELNALIAAVEQQTKAKSKGAGA